VKSQAEHLVKKLQKQRVYVRRLPMKTEVEILMAQEEALRPPEKFGVQYRSDVQSSSENLSMVLRYRQLPLQENAQPRSNNSRMYLQQQQLEDPRIRIRHEKMREQVSAELLLVR
jgi:hypothetical protein